MLYNQQKNKFLFARKTTNRNCFVVTMDEKSNISGFIFRKKNKITNTWKKRFVVIDEITAELRIYRNDQEFHPKEIISLENMNEDDVVEEDYNEKKNKYKFSLSKLTTKHSTFKRRDSFHYMKYKFATETLEAREQWIKDIKTTIKNIKLRNQKKYWKEEVVTKVKEFQQYLKINHNIQISVDYESFVWSQEIYNCFNDLFSILQKFLQKSAVKKIHIKQKQNENETSTLDTDGFLLVVIEEYLGKIQSLNEDDLRIMLDETNWSNTQQLLHQDTTFNTILEKIRSLLGKKDFQIQLEWTSKFKQDNLNQLLSRLSKFSKILEQSFKDDTFKMNFLNSFGGICLDRTSQLIKIYTGEKMVNVTFIEPNLQEFKEKMITAIVIHLKKILKKQVFDHYQQKYQQLFGSKIIFSVNLNKITTKLKSITALIQFLEFLIENGPKRIELFIESIAKQNYFIRYTFSVSQIDRSTRIVRGVVYDCIKIVEDKEQYIFSFDTKNIKEFLQNNVPNEQIFDSEEDDEEKTDKMILDTFCEKCKQQSKRITEITNEPITIQKSPKSSLTASDLVSLKTFLEIKNSIQNYFQTHKQGFQISESQLQNIIEKAILRLGKLCALRQQISLQFVKYVKKDDLKAIIKEYTQFNGETLRENSMEELLKKILSKSEKDSTNVPFDVLAEHLLGKVLPLVLKMSIDMSK